MTKQQGAGMPERIWAHIEDVDGIQKYNHWTPRESDEALGRTEYIRADLTTPAPEIESDRLIIEDALKYVRHEYTEVGLNALQRLFAYASQSRADQWQPIETAPRDGSVIILYGKSKHAGLDVVGTGHWYKLERRFVWDNYLGDEPRPPTEWQPLPAPPKGAN